ncbi:hypothetical protein SDC9_124217 [bioreactor metagenome]|uniref:Uncharacterized protein n=1 Tax=bioreactor metagenome TaxID=1076179 RepID=A0A645CJT9_9ZZZZ
MGPVGSQKNQVTDYGFQLFDLNSVFLINPLFRRDKVDDLIGVAVFFDYHLPAIGNPQRIPIWSITCCHVFISYKDIIWGHQYL